MPRSSCSTATTSSRYLGVADWDGATLPGAPIEVTWVRDRYFPEGAVLDQDHGTFLAKSNATTLLNLACHADAMSLRLGGRNVTASEVSQWD